VSVTRGSGEVLRGQDSRRRCCPAPVPRVYDPAIASGTHKPIVATLAAVLAAAALALAAAGCGDGDDTGSTASTSSLPTGELAKGELAATADDLCTQSNEEILATVDPPDFGEDGPQKDELKDSVPYWQETASKEQELIDQLSQLQPAADVQKQYGEFLDLMQKATVDYAKALAAASEQSDLKAFFAAAKDAQKPVTDLASTAASLGMTVCGANEAAQSSDS
jgi:hypothetical protein